MQETMDIHAGFPAKVRCLTLEDLRGTSKTADVAKLVVGEVYTVKYTKVHAYRTDVALMEFPGCLFNTTMFENVPEEKGR